MRIPATDAELRAHLAHANLPALLPAIAQLTGDMSLLSRFAPPSTPMMGAVDGNLSLADQAAIRALAFDALRSWRDGDGTLPPLPSAEALQALMNWCAGDPLPAHYIPLAIEEAALADPDPRRFEWNRRPAPAVLDEFHVLIIGAGFGGVCAAIRLAQAGIPFTICEKNDAVGGTWYENSYPDLRVTFRIISIPSRSGPIPTGRTFSRGAPRSRPTSRPVPARRESGIGSASGPRSCAPTTTSRMRAGACACAGETGAKRSSSPAP